jgi:DNA-directed RNA polymerase specialized sigma24 family protein
MRIGISSETEASMSKDQIFEEYQKWVPVALAWLRRHGFQQEEAEELAQEVWTRIEEHLKRGRTIDSYPRSYFWNVLFHLLSETGRKRKRFGHPMENPPDYGNTGDTDAIDARLDLASLLDEYAAVRPTEAAALRLWLIEEGGDLDAAAQEIARREGLDPHNGTHVYRIKRRMSAYLARFAAWGRENYSDYLEG